ncbi:MAG: cobyrinate a,c-diamide synthase [Deltaproteobacteria bacterium]|nr:cobyrinate a,c-diamide synthase [Deltaproteobacteria bacterium]TLN01487.1 MAG: cobyrinate a,c-diamide synthase [bacterium]
MKSFVIAAPMSGSGKTTVTLGIMECLKRRGLNVAPFKVGPDFIDPGWHRLVTGRPSVNLDGWMCPEQFVRETFAIHSQGADLAVIEGVMGLFDGRNGVSEEGSTAQVAKILASPVILVVDAKSQARSAAALVQGFVNFDSQVRIAGVIFNNVGSANHARILREALAASEPEVKVLGCIPRDESLRIPSRHLGLVTAEENPLSEKFLDSLAALIGAHLDLDRLLSLSSRGQAYTPDKTIVRYLDLEKAEKIVKLAVARDAAFCFVYEDNLRLLRGAGAEIVEFSPLTDAQLPPGISGIYLPGGYPELFAAELSANQSLIEEIRMAIESGMPVYAECGGFIYLTEGVRCQAATTEKPVDHRQDLSPFVGIFPVTTRMLPRRKALGYREALFTADSLLGPAGTVARGHEFHYSEMAEMPHEVERQYQVSKSGAVIAAEGYRYRNCLASYLHLHFGSCPEMADAFVKNCATFKYA